MVAICKLGIFTAKFFPLCGSSEILHNEEVEYTFLTKLQQMTWGKEVKSRTRVSDSEVWVRPKNLLFSHVPRCGWYYVPRHLNSRCFLWTWSWFPWPPLPSISRTTRAALTKCCRLDGLNDRHPPPRRPPHSSGGWMSEIRVPAWLGCGESPLSGLQTATFLPCPHMAGKERSLGVSS